MTDPSNDSTDEQTDFGDANESQEAFRQPESPELLEQLRSDGEQVLASAFAANRDRFWHLVNFRMDRRIAARVDADDVLQRLGL